MLLDDRVQRRTQCAQPHAGPRRFLFANDALHFIQAGILESLPVEWRGTCQQLIEQHAQRVQVGAGIYVLGGPLGLLGTHIQRRADHLLDIGVNRRIGQRLVNGLGDPEVNDFGDRRRTVRRDQNVRGLDVPVDDPFQVGVLNGLADLDE